MNPLALFQELFDAGADRYARDIAPVLLPLTADFAATLPLDPADRVLDLGTGTGSLARLIAPHVRQVIGVDISPASLRIAQNLPDEKRENDSTQSTRRDSREEARTQPRYVRADLHRLPFRERSFTLAAASLGLNATDPDRALRAIRRVLAPGGRLTLQEWGPADPLNRALDEVLAAYAVEHPGATLARLRDALAEIPPRWSDYLQDVDDYRDGLGEAGFTVEAASESAPLAIPLRPAQYLAYWLAWTDRYEEVRALDEGSRAAFMTAARQRLDDFTLPDGLLTWSPVMFRVQARHSA